MDFPPCQILKRAFQDLYTEAISPYPFTWTGNPSDSPLQTSLSITHKATQCSEILV